MGRLIYFIRHGETQWNRLRLFQGQTDIPLNDAGRQQAEKLAQALEGLLPFDRVVSSDLSRATETADILNKGYGTSVLIDPGFREVDFGEWEGLHGNEIMARWPGSLEEWLDTGILQTPGGETQEQLLARAAKSFRHWADKDDYEKMAIVSHGGVIGTLLCSIMGISPTQMRHHIPVNTGYKVISVSGPGQYALAE